MSHAKSHVQGCNIRRDMEGQSRATGECIIRPYVRTGADQQSEVFC